MNFHWSVWFLTIFTKWEEIHHIKVLQLLRLYNFCDFRVHSGYIRTLRACMYVINVVLGSSSNDQRRDGQEVWSFVACGRGRRLWLRDLLWVQESALYVFWRQCRHLYMEVLIVTLSFNSSHTVSVLYFLL